MTFGLAREEVRLISGTFDFVRGSMAHSYPMGVRFDTRKPKTYHFSRRIKAISVARHPLAMRTKKTNFL
jgi:hypothetical protein